MSNFITNILTINGTAEEAAKVRNFIKGSNGESISFESFIPMPKNLKGNRVVEVKGINLPIPNWMFWRIKNWGTKWDAEPVTDEVVDAPNRIIFNTPSTTPVEAIATLSSMFPEVTFNVIFSDENEDSYCGEYTFTNGKMTNKVWFDVWDDNSDDISNDQMMEYYFRTHEYARGDWRKTEDGEWVNINDEDCD